LGETVRVVPPEDRARREPDPEIAEDVSRQVSRIQEPVQPEPPPPEPEAVPELDAAESPTAPEPEPTDEEPQGSDELEALFASLRTSGETAPAQTEDDRPEPAMAAEPDDEPTTDWIEIREARLLPITNRALRGVKKAMTDVQNIALDSLRTDESWRPDDAAIAEALHGELVAVWSESFAAGHVVAEEMTGSKLKRPTTPSSSADTQFAADLASAVSIALDQAGEGPRERQSAASRVFRVWRSDEAERRIRDIALRGYETGIEKSRRVTTG
jgi:hypothetical protein